MLTTQREMEGNGSLWPHLASGPKLDLDGIERAVAPAHDGSAGSSCFVILLGSTAIQEWRKMEHFWLFGM